MKSKELPIDIASNRFKASYFILSVHKAPEGVKRKKIKYQAFYYIYSFVHSFFILDHHNNSECIVTHQKHVESGKGSSDTMSDV